MQYALPQLIQGISAYDITTPVPHLCPLTYTCEYRKQITIMPTFLSCRLMAPGPHHTVHTPVKTPHHTPVKTPHHIATVKLPCQLTMTSLEYHKRCTNTLEQVWFHSWQWNLFFFIISWLLKLIMACVILHYLIIMYMDAGERGGLKLCSSNQ